MEEAEAEVEQVGEQEDGEQVRRGVRDEMVGEGLSIRVKEQTEGD